jgi:mannitol/fructose-specific phosphotransferase system IIA component (Ntr-type)
MRVLAKLARKLMDEAFREALGSAGDAGAMLALLARELEINQDEV